MIYATVEQDQLYFKEYVGDLYDSISDYEETLGLIELAETEEYIIYKTDFSCPYEHLVLVGNNKEKTLSLRAQYQLTKDFDGVIYIEQEK